MNLDVPITNITVIRSLRITCFKSGALRELKVSLEFIGPIEMNCMSLLKEISFMSSAEWLEGKELDQIPFMASSSISTISRLAQFIHRNASLVIKPHAYDLVSVTIKCLQDGKVVYRG